MTAEAPRFQAYWQYIEGRSVLRMPRANWDELQVVMGQPVQIDVTRTPMADVARDTRVVQALAEQKSSATAEIKIFRYDEQDPLPINQDRYTVWVDLLSHESVAAMISGASTELNQNFKDFASQNVFIVKQDRCPDHWLPSLPGATTAIVEST